MTTLVWAPPSDDAPEGIFYPEHPDLSHEQWVAQAHEAAAVSWRAIGERPVRLARRFTTATIHALRTEARGYGKKRRLWEQTTECGQIMLDDGLWYWKSGPLSETTCLMCRRTVRERYEGPCFDRLGDSLADEYDRQQIEECWRIQAEWHKP